MGGWPDGLGKGRVKLLGMLPREKIIEAMTDSQLFLHTAVKDPCPNAIFEAICMGLPVIYNPGVGSSSEIVGNCGIALDETDLTKTITQARQQLSQLQKTVLAQRKRYSVKYAAFRYGQIFEEQTLRGSTTAPAV